MLVDGLWARGISRTGPTSTRGRRTSSPNAALRSWFGHDPSRFDAFRHLHVEELRPHRATIAELRRHPRDGVLTSVYGAKDEEPNCAGVLAEVNPARDAFRARHARSEAPTLDDQHRDGRVRDAGRRAPEQHLARTTASPPDREEVVPLLGRVPDERIRRLS